MKRIFVVLVGFIAAVILMSVSGEKAMPLGDLGYEIADSLDVIINANTSHPAEFAYPEKLAMLRA
ncbi:MAG: hypothetical protein K2M00_06700, partial [Muribaculaceae bacterium]|nr:hypothetical protein [Muribaculaceae bacterium]